MKKSRFTEGEIKADFNNDMSRFIPNQIKARTIDNPEYWQYVQLEIKGMTDPILKPDLQTKKFDMGL